MTKKERIEILLKEYAEIGTLLRAIDESIEVSPVLIDLIGDKAVHLSKNVQLLNQSDVTPAQPQVSSDDFDDEIDESFFIDGDLEYLQYELETEIARVTRSRPLDESVNNPWLANIDNVNGTPLKDYLKTDSKSEASASDENPVMVETIPQTELKEEKSESEINNDITPVYTNVEITDTETVKNLHKEVETKFSEEIKKNVVDTNRKVIRGNLNTGGNKNQTQAFESLFRKHSDNKQVKTSSKTDFRRLLSLNDRFLFQRELFKGDVGMMNYVFDEINSLNNADEFKDYLSHNFSWDYESPVVISFMEIVDRHFTGKLI